VIPAASGQTSRLSRLLLAPEGFNTRPPSEPPGQQSRLEGDWPYTTPYPLFLLCSERLSRVGCRRFIPHLSLGDSSLLWAAECAFRPHITLIPAEEGSCVGSRLAPADQAKYHRHIQLLSALPIPRTTYPFLRVFPLLQSQRAACRVHLSPCCHACSPRRPITG
jgi:hypothetical protein